MNAMVRHIASSYQITMAQAYFLLSVPFEGIPMAKLASLLGIDNSTLTRNYNKLNSMGFVQREQDHLDKRIFYIKLTSSGDEIVDLLNAKIDESTFDILQKIGIDEIDTIHELLEKLSWEMVMKRSQSV
jgi:DNA-binding MarR family transcriptional regulator